MKRRKKVVVEEERVCFSPDEFEKAVMNAPKDSVVLYDEVYDEK